MKPHKRSCNRKESRNPSTIPTRYLLGALALFMVPGLVQAQAQAEAQDADPDIEEVVVTGSYIRNSQFTNASPVVTITQEDLRTSGAANLGEFLRDMPYMENIDTVANILDTQSGQQDSNSARFNLRGLGTESTLTLMDGRRMVNESAIAALLPGIAQRTVEIVTDGGAALYGSDAVAGVANIIPDKEFEGYEGRVYYKRDGRGSTEQSTAEFKMGRYFDIGIHWVGAVEISKRTPLVVSERRRYQEIYDQDSTSAAPGTFVRAPGAATLANTRVDPSCGTFNDINPELSGKFVRPSGTPGGTATAPRCVMYFGEWQDYGRKSEGITVFNNFRYEMTDTITLEFQMSHNSRTSALTSSPSNAVATNLTSLVVPANHPANTFGFAVRPLAWRPFGKFGTLPSDITSDGTDITDYNYYADAYKFGGEFDIPGTTWEGEAWIGYQDSWREFEGNGIRFTKMRDALAGRGGPGGNEWFNPFASSDSRSPHFVAGRTENSQQLVDWLVEDVEYRDTWERLKYFDVVFNGEVFDLPNGTVRAAFGGQVRNNKDFAFRNPLTAEFNNLYATITTPLEPIEDRSSGVRAIFAEVEVPILDNLGIKAAVRSEDFYTTGFNATKPKISVLWEPLETLALRASYGESFLAPSPSQLRPLSKGTCAAGSGIDPLTNLPLDQSDSCTSGNPELNAEESEIVNVGFSWRPIDGLSVDVDYQEIEYINRIGTLISNQITAREYNKYLKANGLTASEFSPATNPAHAAAGIAWALANPNVLIQRNEEGLVTDIYRAPINLSAQFVEGFDVRIRYSFDTQDMGRFTASLGGNYYTRWEYQGDEFSPLADARGIQNGNTGLAPPLPKFKANLGLSWFKGDHSASVTTRYIDELIYDENTLTLGYTAANRPAVIRAVTKADARYSYRFNAFDTDANMTVGITNLFDRIPQRLPQAGGFESRVDDANGRAFYMSVDFNL